MNVMRAGPASLPVSYERALQVLAWASLSERREIQPELSLRAAIKADDAQLSGMIHALTAQGPIFAHAFGSLKALNRDLFLSLRAGMQECEWMRAQGFLNGLSADDLTVSGAGTEFGMELPGELCDLLIGLAPRLGNSVYVAWDNAGSLTARALQTGAHVHCDVAASPAMVSLQGLIFGGHLAVEHTDPIRAPRAVAHGKLVRFDTAVAFPPIGQRYETEIADADRLVRFPERTTLSSVLSVRHLLAVAKNCVLVCVPNGFLFGANAERDLRKSLVKNGQLRAVVALPPGLLSSASIAISLLVLTPCGGETSVRVVNADDDRFRRMLSKTRSELTSLEAIIEATNGAADGSASRDVRAEEIESNDYQLQVTRYLVPDDQKQVQAFLAKAQLTQLRDIVEVIRPPVIKSKGNSRNAFREVGAADLPAYGYLSEPQRQIEVDEEMAKKLVRIALRPLDIVLVAKGSVGKVGLIPPLASDSLIPWVLGQSLVALRVKSQHINPVALFMMLRSDFGQALLKGIVAAGTVPFIQTRELEALSVPVLPMTEQSAAAEVLAHESRLQDEIRGLQEQLSRLSQNLWRLQVQEQTGEEVGTA